MIIFRKGFNVIKVAFAAAILTVAAAEEGSENHQQLDTSSARHLSFGETCTAAVRITDDDDEKNTNDTLDCETANGQLHPVRTPGSFVADKMQDGTLVSGVTKIELSNAYLDLDSGALSSESINLVPSDAEPNGDASVTGTRTMLMVRVIAKDSTTTGTKAQLADSILANKRQLLGCSHNRFTLNPTADDNGLTTNIRNGVVEISLPNTSKSIRNSMVGVITTEINRQFGIQSPSVLANYVMYCLPADTIPRSYAYLGGWQSVMNDNSCLHPGTWIHELGHNLNLHHSNEGNQEYMDTTGLMGNYWYGDDEKMCFNGPKSWQLGWYVERHHTISTSAPKYQGLLGSVLSNPATSGPPIIINVGSYFITFNAATGMTAGTGEAKNQVTVTKQSLNGMRSYLVAKLGPSGTYTITDNRPNCKVTVFSVQATTASVLVELVGVNPTDQPVSPPTRAPNAPTNCPAGQTRVDNHGCLPYTKRNGPGMVYLTNIKRGYQTAHEDIAQKCGGHLASFTSQEEYDSIFKSITLIVYIGLMQKTPCDDEPKGCWYWSDGTPLGWLNWGPGEPNDSGGREHSTEVREDKKWNDSSNYRNIPGIYLLPTCFTSIEGCYLYKAGSKPCQTTPTPAPTPAISCDGKNKTQCKKLKEFCVFGKNKIPGKCEPKKSKYKKDCEQFDAEDTCLNDSGGNCMWDGKCTHKCDGLAKKDCKKVKNSDDTKKMCKAKMLSNPCKGCQSKTNCGQ